MKSKNSNKPITPYDAAKQLVDVLARPEIFNLQDTYQAVCFTIQNECPLTARGLTLDYQNGVLSADYGGGLITKTVNINPEMGMLPTYPCINDAIVHAVDDLNVLFKRESEFVNFESFKYLVSTLAFAHQFQLLNGQRFRFVLLDYFAIVQENDSLPITNKVFYLTRREALDIIDTAITIPYQNF